MAEQIKFLGENSLPKYTEKIKEYVDQKIVEFEASLPTTTVADDGDGNVTLSYSSLSTITDDGEGNITITN